MYAYSQQQPHCRMNKTKQFKQLYLEKLYECNTSHEECEVFILKQNKQWKTTLAKLEITFSCPFLEQCAEHGNDPAAISSKRANLTLSCFVMEASLQTAQFIPNDRHCLPCTCTGCAYKNVFPSSVYFCSSSCVILYLSFLIVWQDLLFSVA